MSCTNRIPRPIEKGATVGYQGHRAVVYDVIEHGRRVRVLYTEKLPASDCEQCGGTGAVSLGEWRSRLRTTACTHCRGTGTRPERHELRDVWVDACELTDPPAEEVTPEIAALAATLGDPHAAVFGRRPA